jgi:hypothetical protein
MTKLELEYELERPLSDDDAVAVADIHSVYGFMRVTLAPSMDRITVEYDASRLSERDVENWLIRYRIPIKREPAAVPM